MPALTYDPALAQSAQAWADRCVFQHSGPGENMAMAYGTMAGTDAWYNEVRGSRGAAPEVLDAGAVVILCLWALAPGYRLQPSIIC